MTNDSPLPPTGARPYHDVMPKLTLALNSRVQVRLASGYSSMQALRGEFIGLSHYDFVIIKVPSVPGLRNVLFPRVVFEVRFFQDGAVCLFQSEILSHSTKPALIIFFKYPDRISISEMREHKRCGCTLPVSISSTYGDYTGIISNISLSGCRFTVEVTSRAAVRQLNVGDELVLQMPLRSDGELAIIKALVKSVETVNNFLSVGVSFDNLTSVHAQAIEGYLALLKIVET